MKNLKTLLYLIPMVFLVNCNSNKSQENNDEAVLDNVTQNGELAAAVKQNDEWLFINEKGEKLFDKSFTYASQFNDGIACVAEDGQRFVNAVLDAHYYGMNTQGEKIDKIKSDMPFQFGDERAFITQEDRTYLVDTKGNVIKYVDGAQGTVPFNDGKAAILVGPSVQIWDKNGDIVKDGLDMNVGQFVGGYFTFLKNNKFGFLDKDGNVAQEAVYADVFDFEEGLASVQDESGQWYYINTNFEKVLGPYQYGRGVREEVIAVQQDDLWQFIDKEGNSVIEEKFSQADSFFEGLAIVIRQDQQVGFINKEGEFTPIDARVALGFKNGLSIAEKDQKMGFINTQGEWVVPAVYERVNNFNKLK